MKRGKIKRHGNCKGERLQRDEHIKMKRRIGKKMEEKEWIQSLFYKQCIGFNGREVKVHGRQANEVFLKCKLLNDCAKGLVKGNPDKKAVISYPYMQQRRLKQ